MSVDQFSAYIFFLFVRFWLCVRLMDVYLDTAADEEEVMSIWVYVGCGIFILICIIGFVVCCVIQEKKARREKALQPPKNRLELK